MDLSKLSRARDEEEKDLSRTSREPISLEDIRRKSKLSTLQIVDEQQNFK